MCCRRDGVANNSWLQLRERRSGKQFCGGVPVLSAQLIMAELSMQTPGECIPSQCSGASSELPLTGSDATLFLSQSPHSVLSSTIASDALAVPLLPPLVLSLLSLPGMPAVPTPPPFSTASQASCFLEPRRLKQKGFQHKCFWVN